MVDSIIRKCLADSRRVVVPELGAFLKKDTGEIVFVEFLKKDDGLLVSAISKELGIPEQDARDITDSFAADVRRITSDGIPFILEGTGKLKKDPNGLLELEYVPGIKKSDFIEREVPVIITEEPVKDEPEKEEPEKEDIKEEIANIFSRQDDIARPVSPRAASVSPELPVIEKEAIPVKNEPAPVEKPADSINEAYQKKKTLNDLLSGKIDGKTESAVNPRPQKSSPQNSKPLVDKSDTVRPRPQQPRPVDFRSKKKKTDLVMIIAIIAAVIAIGSMIYGIFVNKSPIDSIQPTQTEILIDQLDGREEIAETE